MNQNELIAQLETASTIMSVRLPVIRLLKLKERAKQKKTTVNALLNNLIADDLGEASNGTDKRKK